jgi:cytochrome P450
VWPRNEKNENTLTLTDKMAYARKRRVLNSAFSEKAVRSAESFVINNIDRWNEILVDGSDGKEWTQPKNASEITNQLIFDIVGDLTFGKSFDLKEPGNGSFKNVPNTIMDFLEFLKFMYPVFLRLISHKW